MTEAEIGATHARPPATSQPTHGEPCQECGAPLAVDQRYCLNCGRRRGEARVDYRHYMATAAGSAAAEGTVRAQPAPADDRSIDPTMGGSIDRSVEKARDYTPLAAVGGIAVLGLMLLVGVLIGRGGGDTAQAPAPIVVPGGGEGAETTGAGEGEAAGAGSKSAATGGKKSAGKEKGGALSGGGAGKDEEAVEANDEALESLHSQSGASYEEQSKKLPNKIATPGKPPPIDKSTPPGGGEGGGEVIK